MCRQLNYKDGIVNYNVNKSLKSLQRWVTGFFCQGSEKTMMTCLNTGFNSTFLDDLCMRRTDEPGAYTECFNDTVGKILTLHPPYLPTSRNNRVYSSPSLIRPLPTNATSLYKARFQMYRDSKILLNCPAQERPPLIRPLPTKATSLYKARFQMY